MEVAEIRPVIVGDYYGEKEIVIQNGLQLLFRVRQHRAHQERAGILAEGRVGEVDLPLVGIERAVGERDLDLVVAVLRLDELLLGDLVAQFGGEVLRHAEVHPDRIDRRDIGEVRAVALRVDERPLALPSARLASPLTGERIVV